MDNLHEPDEIPIDPEKANDEILDWGFREVPEHLVYSKRMEMENPQYIIENISLTGIVHSHSGWRWTKRSDYKGFEYQIDILENCKFVKDEQEISVLWNDDNPSNKRYRVEMRPVGMTEGIVDSLYSLDSQYYKYRFFTESGNDMFNYKNNVIENITTLANVINGECEKHAIESYDYIRTDDLKQIAAFVENLIKIKECS